MLGELLGVQVSAETARRLAEQMGAWMNVIQTQEREKEASHAPSEQPTPERRVVSADGAMISLVHKQWVEVRTATIGEPVIKPGIDGEAEIHVGQLSYFSRLADASTFIELVAGEMRRRFVAQAKQVCVVTDGAEWCQAFADRYRPDVVRILDFPHAAEHLSALLEGCSQADLRLPDQMLSRCLHILKHRGPTALLRMAARLSPELAQQKGVEEHVEYLRKREALIQYPQFRAQSWPIGSGTVESANKLVVQARLKGPGMHWERKNVNPMLALRLAVCNDRWQEMWSSALAARKARSAYQQSACPAHPSSAPASERTASSVSYPNVAPVVRRQRAPRPQGTASAHSTGAGEAKGDVGDQCQVCGTTLVRVRGHRRRQYCSDRCRTRACRARGTTSSPRLLHPRQGKHFVLPHRSCTQVKRPRSSRTPRPPFVKVHADRCPCGAPVEVVPGRGHRPRQYCSDRCRMRAHRWRHAEQATAAKGR